MSIQPLSKYGASGLTFKEERKARKLARKAESDDVKAEAKARDGNRCRWPHCEFTKGKPPVTENIEAAHIQAAGMGGDPKQLRTTRDNLIGMCDLHHRRAPQNMHNGGLKVEPLTPDGTDGPCSFHRWDSDRHEYFIVAQEIEPRILGRD